MTHTGKFLMVCAECGHPTDRHNLLCAICDPLYTSNERVAVPTDRDPPRSDRAGIVKGEGGDV